MVRDKRLNAKDRKGGDFSNWSECDGKVRSSPAPRRIDPVQSVVIPTKGRNLLVAGAAGDSRFLHGCAVSE
jgi:hypothetical protein